MIDYEVRFVYDLVNIVTYVVADDEWQARRMAEIQVYDSVGMDSIDSLETVVMKVGEFA
jgi:hypothetical protein